MTHLPDRADRVARTGLIFVAVVIVAFVAVCAAAIIKTHLRQDTLFAGATLRQGTPIELNGYPSGLNLALPQLPAHWQATRPLKGSFRHWQGPYQPCGKRTPMSLIAFSALARADASTDDLPGDPSNYAYKRKVKLHTDAGTFKGWTWKTRYSREWFVWLTQPAGKDLVRTVDLQVTTQAGPGVDRGCSQDANEHALDALVPRWLNGLQIFRAPKRAATS